MTQAKAPRPAKPTPFDKGGMPEEPFKSEGVMPSLPGREWQPMSAGVLFTVQNSWAPTWQTCTSLPVRLESQIQMRNVFRGHHVSLGLNSLIIIIT